MPDARETFEAMCDGWLGGPVSFDDLLAEDAVVETPFSPPGHPRRFDGKAEFVAFAERTRGELPIRFDECRNVTVHETTDPDRIVVEYELAGTVLPAGQSASAAFIGVLRVRDGRITHWREYQNTLAITEFLGGLPS
ncbi:nuclear transport factor 2 family protein [Amycolatopsis albispora]|uniref:PhzA/B-like protein n=1 Tax=Amycolatopsis albispora TaxID=1804986 RepID=A0A344LG63_9PSEU|nr:nuclear transport factor 2 family protein [Amycolatopsis albispora]AXB47037.1 phzA/B-like protein [Amycolatopsis albispora]